jgi:hypothetical protein
MSTTTTTNQAAITRIEAEILQADSEARGFLKLAQGLHVYSDAAELATKAAVAFTSAATLCRLRQDLLGAPESAPLSEPVAIRTASREELLAELLKDLGANYEYPPGYVSINYGRHDYAIGTVNGEWSADRAPLWDVATREGVDWALPLDTPLPEVAASVRAMLEGAQ